MASSNNLEMFCKKCCRKKGENFVVNTKCLLCQIALALEFAVIMIVMKDVSKEVEKNT